MGPNEVAMWLCIVVLTWMTVRLSLRQRELARLMIELTVTLLGEPEEQA